MIYRVVVNLHRQLLQRIAFRLRDVVVFLHLVQYGVSSVQRPLCMTNRIVQRRVLTHTYQNCRFLCRQVYRLFAEIYLRSTLDTHCIVQKIKLIQVHHDDLVLRVQTFQLHRYDPFVRFLQQALKRVRCSRRVELFAQLLCDRTAATGFTQRQQRTNKSLRVNARMAVETRILRGHQRIDDIRRNLLVVNTHAVLRPIVSAQRNGIVREHLTRILVLRILQVLQRRHIPKPTSGYPYKKEHHKQQSQHKHQPEPLGKLYPKFCVHISLKNLNFLNS